MLPQGTDLTPQDVADLSHQLREELPLWARVLADARYYTWSDEWAAPERAVLLAAVACELAAKETLRESAHAETGALVELLLERPRDWSLAAVSLFDEHLRLVTGHSLRDDDRELWKQVNSLFQERNRIAHRGARMDGETARMLVDSAVQATEWLATVGAGSGS